MVSKARDDLPEPETPVITVNWLCGSESEIFLRLWTRAPRIRMYSCKVIFSIEQRRAAAENAAIRDRMKRRSLACRYGTGGQRFFARREPSWHSRQRPQPDRAVSSW